MCIRDRLVTERKAKSELAEKLKISDSSLAGISSELAAEKAKNTEISAKLEAETAKNIDMSARLEAAFAKNAELSEKLAQSASRVPAQEASNEISFETEAAAPRRRGRARNDEMQAQISIDDSQSDGQNRCV